MENVIPRKQLEAIKGGMIFGKAIIIIGPRQVGKTTLAKMISSEAQEKALWLTGDDPATRSELNDITLAGLKPLIGSYKLLVIDEAQRIKNAGLTLKLIIDNFPDVQLLITGSSTLDIASETKESLVGRKLEFVLYPFSFVEMAEYHGILKEKSLLDHRLVYGYYPEVVKHDASFSRRLLNDLTDGLMYKDILAMDQIKKPSLITKLLQALALQLGSEVKYNELAQLTGSDPATVEKYIDLLEKSFVIFRLPSLSRNARNEIKKGKKVYFFDNVIRNAIIKNFSTIDLRQDKGALWENFLVAERLKYNTYREHYYNAFFWRTTAQQEIDYLEESDGQFFAYEFKWNPKKKGKFSKTFLQNYKVEQVDTIHPNNFEAFVGWQ